MQEFHFTTEKEQAEIEQILWQRKKKKSKQQLLFLSFFIFIVIIIVLYCFTSRKTKCDTFSKRNVKLYVF